MRNSGPSFTLLIDLLCKLTKVKWRKSLFIPLAQPHFTIEFYSTIIMVPHPVKCNGFVKKTRFS